MMTVRINVDPIVAEYVRSKYPDEETGAVRFPSSLDIYVMLFDLMQRRPADKPVDEGNLEICLPDRRVGKDPIYYNYLSDRAQKIINAKLRTMVFAELHDMVDENKHLRGIQFKDSIFAFICRYGIESVSEDALWKNYQRWRAKLRRRKKRDYNKKGSI